MPQMQQLSSSQASPEVPINENFESLEHQAVYGKKHTTTTGLTWGYYGGRWGGLSVSDGTVALTGANTNYVVVARATGAVSTSTATTNWNNFTQYARAYKITTGGSSVSAVEDHRAGVYGVHGPFPIIPGTGSPEGVVTAPIGTLYVNLSGGASTTLYVKTSGTGNTGWTAK